jgi:hypothetical protein
MGGGGAVTEGSSVQVTTGTPGATFAAGIQLSTGVHRGPGFSVAQVLAFHVPPPHCPAESVESITAGMRALADSMQLGPHDQDPPFVGHRVSMRSGTPWLDYGHDGHFLVLPIGAQWREVAEGGGPIRILWLLDPLTPLADRSAIEAHVSACYDRGAMRWGTTYVRNR